MPLPIRRGCGEEAPVTNRAPATTVPTPAPDEMEPRKLFATLPGQEDDPWVLHWPAVSETDMVLTNFRLVTAPGVAAHPEPSSLPPPPASDAVETVEVVDEQLPATDAHVAGASELEAAVQLKRQADDALRREAVAVQSKEQAEAARQAEKERADAAEAQMNNKRKQPGDGVSSSGPAHVLEAERKATEFLRRCVVATPDCAKCKVSREGVKDAEGRVVKMTVAGNEVPLTAAYVASEYPLDPEKPKLIPKHRNAADARGCCYWAHSVSLQQLDQALKRELTPYLKKYEMKAWRKWILAFMTETMGATCHGAKRGLDGYDLSKAAHNKCTLYDALRDTDTKPVAVDPTGRRATDGGDLNMTASHHHVFMGYQLHVRM